MGLKNLPDFSGMAAVTFGNVVISHQFFTDSLLFHELVHVEQFRQLGIERFADLYVQGFLNGGGYDGIPLERNAYELEAWLRPSRTRTPIHGEDHDRGDLHERIGQREGRAAGILGDLVSLLPQ